MTNTTGMFPKVGDGDSLEPPLSDIINFIKALKVYDDGSHYSIIGRISERYELRIYAEAIEERDGYTIKCGSCNHIMNDMVFKKLLDDEEIYRVVCRCGDTTTLRLEGNYATTLSRDFKQCKFTHACNCGTGTSTPHLVGGNGCRRIMEEISPVQFIHDFSDSHAERIIDGKDRWIMGAGSEYQHAVNRYSLKEQRGYHKHDCGCWLHTGTSTNSLGGDW